jgi:hypothetical protein
MDIPLGFDATAVDYVDLRVIPVRMMPTQQYLLEFGIFGNITREIGCSKNAA